MDTCFLHSVEFTFALKKGFQRNLDFIWFNKIFLSKKKKFFFEFFFFIDSSIN